MEHDNKIMIIYVVIVIALIGTSSLASNRHQAWMLQTLRLSQVPCAEGRGAQYCISMPLDAQILCYQKTLVDVACSKNMSDANNDALERCACINLIAAISGGNETNSGTAQRAADYFEQKCAPRAFLAGLRRDACNPAPADHPELRARIYAGVGRAGKFCMRADEMVDEKTGRSCDAASAYERTVVLLGWRFTVNVHNNTDICVVPASEDAMCHCETVMKPTGVHVCQAVKH
jgi:hypothetical protein